MRVTVRFKLILTVASAVLTLSAIVIQSDIIGATNRGRLRDIEARLVPRMDAGPRITAAFVRLRREFQDAAAAQDPAALAATIETRNQIFELITKAGAAIEPMAASELRWAIQDYYVAAHAVSTSLIAGETGERQLQTQLDQMAEMQRRLRRVEEVMHETTEVDQKEVARAFVGARDASINASNQRRLIGLAGIVTVLVLGYWASRQMLRSLEALSSGLARFSTGDFQRPVHVATNDELADVAAQANTMARSLEELADARDRDDWVRRAHVEIAEQLRGNLPQTVIAERTLRFLVERTGAVAGALYLLEGPATLVLAGSYARDAGSASSYSDGLLVVGRPIKPSFAVGEGLVGQAFLRPDLTIIDEVPAGYFKVVSGLGEGAPRALGLLPLSRPDKTIGVIELGLWAPLDRSARELLESIRTMLAVTFEAASARFALESALSETQRQAERLAAQEEELRQNNQELAAQQEELRRANDELEAQRKVLSDRNRDLDTARERIQEKAEELGRVSQYKSQFLANMSHELRTPLNSMLLLSHLLAENGDQTLSPKQIEYARTIHGAGEDLLQLINQVLDLSKIEAGKEELDITMVSIAELTTALGRIFRPLAAEKGLELRISVDPATPQEIQSDRVRVERILINLLGNAIKFTERGTVALDVRPVAHRGPGKGPTGTVAAPALAFAVSDTGIGIPESERERVFVPFEQLEATSARRYQGTGLGLSIARDSAILLGGELALESVVDRGSTFTLTIPVSQPALEHAAPLPKPAPRADDRTNLEVADPHILVIEDDPILSEQLFEIVHARGLKALLARTGEEGLALARAHAPRGIVLDIKLPDIDGWTVLERLRLMPETRDIPVHFLSALDAPTAGMARGAVGYLTKPATRAELIELILRLSEGKHQGERRILIVEDNELEGRSLTMALEAENFQATLVPSARDALRVLGEQEISCIVLDLGLPDMDGLLLLQELRRREDCAGIGVLVHTGRSLTKKETRELESYAEAVVLKDQSSLARLLEELRLFVHHVRTRTDAVELSSSPATLDHVLAGTRVLIVEDDMRTAYSLLALLQSRGCEVTVAENGKEALSELERAPEVHCVLMDIMMPEMDGYETTRRLRARPAFARLPIIALTAKAMPGERERCLAAGASDYLTKPVDSAKLLSTLHRWTKETGL